MLTIHEEDYPIVTVHFEGTTTLEDTKTYLSRFETWLLRVQPFGIIVHQTNSEDAEPNQVKEVHQFTAQWAKQHKPQISQYCAGIAMTFDSAVIVAARQGQAPKLIETLFGCSGQVFEARTDAHNWLQQQINSFVRSSVVLQKEG
jgi:hypothetical protein